MCKTHLRLFAKQPPEGLNLKYATILRIILKGLCVLFLEVDRVFSFVILRSEERDCFGSMLEKFRKKNAY